MFHGQSQNVFAGTLSKIADDLEDAVTAGDLGAIGNCVGNLRDLRLTLDAAEGCGDDKVQGQRAVTLTVNGKVYHVKWYDQEHDADGGCWQTLAIGNGWSWRTLDELVDYIYKNNP